jgi:hypothetical protein
MDKVAIWLSVNPCRLLPNASRHTLATASFSKLSHLVGQAQPNRHRLLQTLNGPRNFQIMAGEREEKTRRHLRVGPASPSQVLLVLHLLTSHRSRLSRLFQRCGTSDPLNRPQYRIGPTSMFYKPMTPAMAALPANLHPTTAQLTIRSRSFGAQFTTLAQPNYKPDLSALDAFRFSPTRSQGR